MIHSSRIDRLGWERKNAFVNNFTSLLTTAALLLHMILGCCAHHAHAQNVANAEVPNAKPCCSHGHSKANDNSDGCSKRQASDEAPASDCDESDCSFVTGDSSHARDWCCQHSLPVFHISIADFTQQSPTYSRVGNTLDPIATSVSVRILFQSFLI